MKRFESSYTPLVVGFVCILILQLPIFLFSQTNVAPVPLQAAQPRDVLLMQGTNIEWTTAASVTVFPDMVVRSELKNGTNFVYWETLDTNVIPIYPTVNLTNFLPPAPRGFRLCWKVPGSVLMTSSLTNPWLVTNVNLLVSADVSNQGTKFFRAPTIVAGIPPAGAITLTWDAYPYAIQSFNFYYGPSNRVYTNKFTFSGTNNFIDVTGLPAGQAKFFALTVTDVLGLESNYTTNEPSYIAPGPTPIVLPIQVLPR